MRTHAAADAFGAFCPYPPFQKLPRRHGLLDGLTFAVKDMIDVADVPTGAGSPEWRATHGVPYRSAPIVTTLLDAGARLVAKTQTDELAYSLSGDNVHFGTPVNPAAPDRMPGGSSSGSAVAAAARLVDFSIGSDTGGSIRLPASFCGVYGIRTSHGRIALDGIVPLAPSFDTIGWFAADPALFETVGAALFPDDAAIAPRRRLLIAADAFELAGDAVGIALGQAVAHVSRGFSDIRHVAVAPDGLAIWRETFRTIQAREAWAAHGPWITTTKPRLGPGIAERFQYAATVTAGAAAAAGLRRAEVRRRMDHLLGDGAILVLPSAPGPAPLRTAPMEEVERFRAAALAKLCIAGLAGLPQVSLPLARLDGAPLGLSLVGRRGSDRSLLRLAADLAGAHAL